MCGWHHRLNGHASEQAPGVSGGQRSLACCSPWGQRVKHHLAPEQQNQQGRGQFNPWVGKICWRRDRLPTPVCLGFPCGSAGEESARNSGDLGSIPGLGRSPGEGNGNPLQCSGLENSLDCIVHGVAKSQTRLSGFHFHGLWRPSAGAPVVTFPLRDSGRSDPGPRCV